MNVAIQGQTGSYHHQAVSEYFSKDTNCLFYDTFQAVFDSLQDKTATHALIASENSLYGSINRVYDLLFESDAHIIGEQYLQIHHQLIGVEDIDISQLTDVYSHPVALEQCRNFIANNLAHAKIHAHTDTAGALAEVIENHATTSAAIAGTHAWEIYGGHIIASHIETNSENYTRFIVLSLDTATEHKANKTSITLSMPTDQQSGSLYQALGFFADNNINLTKLESRPIVGRAWHYLFYIDLEGSSTDETLQAAFNQLDYHGYSTRILGSY